MSDASPSDVAGVVDSYCRNSYAGSPEFVTALDGELSGDLAERMGVRDICKVALGAARLGWELSGEAMDMMDARLEASGCCIQLYYHMVLLLSLVVVP